MNVKKILTSIFCFLLLTAAYASPRRDKELVQSDSWVYDALTSLAIQNGRVDFSDDSPLTIGQIKLLLSEYNYDSLSPSSKYYYDKIMDYISDGSVSFESGLFSFGLEPEINLEGYYKNNDELSWVYDRYSRKEFLTVPASFNIEDYLTMEMDLAFTQSGGWSLHNDNYVNIPFPVNSVDVNFPRYGYLSTGLDLPKDSQINFRIGLGGQSIGRSINGSVILSQYMTGSSWANLEFFYPNFKFDMNVTQFNVDKYMYTHRFDLRLFKKIQFGAMESILVYAPLELRFLNPFGIYHGLTPWLDYSGKSYEEGFTCAYMCFKLAYAPCPYLRLYGLFAQDQFQTSYELKNWPNDTTPNAMGFQLGAESIIPLPEGQIHIWAEGYYAQPYLYIKEDPNWSLVRTYRENIGDQTIFYEWVGSPFGPDTVAGQISLGYESRTNWNVSFDYLFKAAGEYSGTKVFTDALNWGGHDTSAAEGEWVYPDKTEQGLEEAKRRQALVTPSGIPEYLNRFALRGSYNFNDYLSLTMQGAFVFVFNADNVSGNFQCGPEFAASLSFDLSKLANHLIKNNKNNKSNESQSFNQEELNENED